MRIERAAVPQPVLWSYSCECVGAAYHETDHCRTKQGEVIMLPITLTYDEFECLDNLLSDEITNYALTSDEREICKDLRWKIRRAQANLPIED